MLANSLRAEAMACACRGSLPSTYFVPGDNYISITLEGNSYQYPVDYGTNRCAPWDAGHPPYCAAPYVDYLTEAADWCTSPWCFVDADNCSTASDSANLPGMSYIWCDDSTATESPGLDEATLAAAMIAPNTRFLLPDRRASCEAGGQGCANPYDCQGCAGYESALTNLTHDLNCSEPEWIFDYLPTLKNRVEGFLASVRGHERDHTLYLGNLLAGSGCEGAPLHPTIHE